MFPLKDANPKHGPALTMWLLVGLNTLVFAYEFTLFDNARQLERFLGMFGFIPNEFFNVPLAEFFTLLSSMFLHGGLMHLAGNMFFLFVFGDNVEDKMGHGRFVLFYVLGGVVATLAHGAFSLGSSLPLVGASGAISAVLGAYIVLFPRQKVLTFIPPLLILWLPLRLFGKLRRFFMPWLPAWLFIGYWALLQIIEAATGLVTPEANMTNVAWWAHVGGFVFGVAMVRFFVKPQEAQLPGSISP